MRGNQRPEYQLESQLVLEKSNWGEGVPQEMPLGLECKKKPKENEMRIIGNKRRIT